MAKRRVNATSQQIMDAFKKATDPKSTPEQKAKAEEWLRKENAKMTKAANERIADMKRKGFIDKSGQGTAAYNIAKQDLKDLNQDKFLYRKSMDVDDLKNNMLAARKFLESQTSTASGERKRREKIYKTLVKNNYITPPEDEAEADKMKQRFYDFLDSDVFDDFKKTIGTNIVTEAYEAIEQGMNVTDLIDMYKEYETRTDVDAFDVWDSWTQGKALPEGE